MYDFVEKTLVPRYFEGDRNIQRSAHIRGLMTINLNAVSPSLKTRLACANGSRNTFANQTIFLDFLCTV